jgi:hypothetical protein
MSSAALSIQIDLVTQPNDKWEMTNTVIFLIVQQLYRYHCVSVYLYVRPLFCVSFVLCVLHIGMHLAPQLLLDI